MKKKILAALSAFVTAFSLLLTVSACGGQDTNGQDTSVTPPGEETEDDQQGSVTPEEPPATEHTHSYESRVTIEATCEHTGEITYTCSCGDSYTQEIPKTDHNFVDGICTMCGLGFTQGLEYVLLEDSTYMLTGRGTSTDANLIIPATYNGLPVASIMNNAFFRNNYITSVIIPDSITSIGEDAFAECTALQSVTISKGVVSIGKTAFGECTALTEINFNARNCNDLEYGDNVFEYAGQDGEGITLNVGEEVTRIPASLFYATDGGVQSDEMAPNVTAVNFAPDCACAVIGYRSFSGCSGIASIFLPSSLVTIGDFAFSGCSFTEITIPENVSSFGTRVCGDNTFLESIIVDSANQTYYSAGNCIIKKSNGVLVYGCKTSVIPQGVTGIASYAFYNCDGLTHIDIPSGVTSIGQYAFYDCDGLATITVGDGLESIGVSAFNNSAITSITLPESITDIAENAFTECLQLKSVTFDGDSHLQSIGLLAFSRCSAIEEITIPASVTSLGDSAFSLCTGLKKATFARNNQLDIIAERLFQGCTSLEEVNIPDTVTQIGEYAFHNCSALVKVNMPQSLTEICEYAFSNCSSIKSVSIPSGVTKIGNYAFENCTGLEGVYITDLAAWCNVNFEYAANNGGAQPLYCAGKLYLNGVLITQLVIPNGVQYITATAFLYCRDITTVVIPQSVTTISDSAFSNCMGITSVFYCGTAEEWSSVSIARTGNSPLTGADTYFYSESQPTEAGNYWHYAADGVTPVVWGEVTAQ